MKFHYCDSCKKDTGCETKTGEVCYCTVCKKVKDGDHGDPVLRAFIEDGIVKNTKEG